MKIIASDYDGTLNHGGIDDTKRAAIKKWRDSGNVFAIVSGRGPEDALLILKKDNLEIDYFVAANGAVILNSKGQTVSDIHCNGNLAEPILELLFECGCQWGHVIADTPCMVYEDDEIPAIEYFNQISTALPDYDTAEKVTSVVKEKFGDFVNPLQNGTCIDIVRTDIDKAKGIYLLLDILDAEHDDVIAVGDNINDIAMIKKFRSYAMENGVEIIKEIANNIIESVTQLIEKEL